MRSCSAWAASTLSHTVHDDPSDGDQEAQPKDRIHGVLPSTLPLDIDRLRSLVGLASASLVPPSGVWQRGRFRIIVRCFARLRCGLHAWKPVRGIQILHHAYQLSTVGERSTAPEMLVWNTQESLVSSHVEIIGVERDDGDQGLPSDSVGHRFRLNHPSTRPSPFLTAVLTVSPMNVPRSFVRYLTSHGLAMSWE